jgi:hypothetical protein
MTSSNSRSGGMIRRNPHRSKVCRSFSSIRQILAACSGRKSLTPRGSAASIGVREIAVIGVILSIVNRLIQPPGISKTAEILTVARRYVNE